MFWNVSRVYFSFLAYKTLWAIVTLFFSNFFQSSFCDGKFIPSQLYSFVKGLILLFFADLFLFLRNLTQLLQRIGSTYYLFYWQDLLLLFNFLSNQENWYMIHHDSDLFCDIYNTTAEHNRICFLLQDLNFPLLYIMKKINF